MHEGLQSEVETPHFHMPFRFGGMRGGAWVNEQDSEHDIVDCIKVILAFPEGSRIDNPDFGVPDLLFRQRVSDLTTTVHEAITEWEPRADTIVDSYDDWDEFVYNLYITISGIGDE